MSKLEELINSISDDELEYIQETVFDEDGNLISQEKFNEILYNEKIAEDQQNAIQFALKINLNSVDKQAA